MTIFVQVSVSLSFTSGTLRTSYDESCHISSNLWTISFCMLREGHDDQQEDQDDRLYGHKTCSFIQIDPDRPETEVRLDKLEPCTQYTFTLYTRHLLGNKGKEVREEKVITEMTQCQGELIMSSSILLLSEQG